MANVVEEIFSFGMWVRRRRKALDLTQGGLAQQVGCAEVTIRKLEADVFRPSREIAERLAVCLQIPSDEREIFLQTARAGRSVDRLPDPHAHVDTSRRPSDHPPVVVEKIPLDMIPLPAPLPPGSRMPLSRNPLFVGREQALRQLAQALKVGATVAIGQMEVAAATGLGGIGKTQLACELVHRYGQFFSGGVLWLSFADPDAVPAEVAACGGVDGMQLSQEFGALPLDEQVRQVLRAWNSPTPRLLVFDNCEDETLLDQWKPKYGGCRVLVTSRRAQWDAALSVHALPLDVLPRPESIALLRSFRPDLPATNAEIDAIADTLGDLPLALHLAGSFLAKYRHAITPGQYLSRLRTPTLLNDRSLREAGLSPTKHVQHVARTFEQSYERLDPADATDSLALKLIATAACCAPGEPIPRWFLLRTLILADDPDAVFLTEDALTRLIDLGLLETDEDNVRLHRLLVAFMRAVEQDADVQSIVETTMLRAADQLNRTLNPRPLLALQSHLRFITDAVQHYEDERTAGLSNALGYHLWLLGAYAESRNYLERALAIRQQVLEPDHPELARSLNNLGLALQGQGSLAGALAYFQQALAIRERVLGENHPDTAWSLDNVGTILLELGNLAGARSYLERALAIQERELGREHQATAWSLNILGKVLKALGDYSQAQDMYEQAFTILERLLGVDHPETARSLDGLGEVLSAQGDLVRARQYYEQAFAIRARVLGENHPDAARSLSNLGEVLWDQGTYNQALSALERALTIQQRMLGQHPDTARTLNTLGVVQHATGSYEQALSALKQALEILEPALGDHPDTARTLNSLGMVKYEQGDFAAARQYQEQALKIQEQVLGSDHSHTAWSLYHLGKVLYAQGEFAPAHEHHERALQIREQVLGTDHIDTARSLYGLATVLQARGDLAGGRKHFERALSIFEQRLGMNHPVTQSIRTTLSNS